MDRSGQFRRFREEYPDFSYKKYEYTLTRTSLDMTFHFEIAGLSEFHPSWSVPLLESHKMCISANQLDRLIFSLGMTELISYWKPACSPNVHIECGALTPEQAVWWKKLYAKGLGEFFYMNGIPFQDSFMNISPPLSDGGTSAGPPGVFQSGAGLPKVLVPVGGGKDSAVTLELLKNAADRYCYIINPRQATLDTARVSRLSEKTIAAKRTLDANMLALNSKGFLNGHTPFSAIVAFSSVIAASLHGIEYIALSNESSANEATVAGSDVNHQYSKSYEFERDFRNYEAEYISTGINYFSFLRPLTELKIAKLFAPLKEYRSIFRSCNAGSKTDVWCGKCPKCLFVYILLSPFVDARELTSVFGKNMLDDGSLTDTFEKLTGIQPEKPFECVGSREEVLAALQMTAEKYADAPAPLLLKYYKERFRGTSAGSARLLDLFDENHFLPSYFLSLLKQKI